MFSKLRNRYGAAGPIAVLALIVAVAFAGVPAVAAPVANTSASLVQKVAVALKLARVANKKANIANKRSINAIRFARNVQKEQGPTGPQGPKGDKGSTGSAGAAGADGATGPTGATGPQGDPGDPWTAGGVLPEGSTETGVWGAVGEGFHFLTGSFGIPLSSELGENEVHFQGEDAEFAVFCEGSVAFPEALSGHLCVYVKTFSNMALINGPFDPNTSGLGAGAAGFGVTLSGANAFAQAQGTWAVTG